MYEPKHGWKMNVSKVEYRWFVHFQKWTETAIQFWNRTASMNGYDRSDMPHGARAESYYYHERCTARSLLPNECRRNNNMPASVGARVALVGTEPEPGEQ